MNRLKKDGYVRVRVNGEMHEATEEIELDKNKKHQIEVIIDRIVIKEGVQTRIADSLETALSLADGRVLVDIIDGEELLFSQHHACPECGFSIPELEPRAFSFNSPYGACQSCDGLGVKLEVDSELVIPDASRSLNDGAVAPWEPTSSTYYPQLLQAICEHFSIDMNVPFEKLPEKQQNIILNGSGKEKNLFFTMKMTLVAFVSI